MSIDDPVIVVTEQVGIVMREWEDNIMKEINASKKMRDKEEQKNTAISLGEKFFEHFNDLIEQDEYTVFEIQLALSVFLFYTIRSGFDDNQKRNDALCQVFSQAVSYMN